MRVRVCDNVPRTVLRYAFRHRASAYYALCIDRVTSNQSEVSKTVVAQLLFLPQRIQSIVRVPTVLYLSLDF